ncbi:MAG: 2'-5' RNA ligase family protein [Bacteroidetes bacterium]|nr:2'-5' RNA ligase family protein [Bacteroidota bacterium]MBS1671159.1 2'-5' RNA ligase family protein [Bacteroidota bacterium]
MQQPFLDNELVTESFTNKQLNLHDYLLIISPSEDVQQKITEIKKQFSIEVDCPAALHGKPQITLLRFLQMEMMERKIITKMKLLIEAASSFQITIDGFGSFPSHTIYANIITKNNIINMVKFLKPLQPLVKLDKWNKGHFITEPHITIAKKLLPFQYEKGWNKYMHENFKASFMVNKVLLLKRQINNKNFSVVKQFVLLNKAVPTVTQNSLLFL